MIPHIHSGTWPLPVQSIISSESIFQGTLSGGHSFTFSRDKDLPLPGWLSPQSLISPRGSPSHRSYDILVYRTMSTDQYPEVNLQFSAMPGIYRGRPQFVTGQWPLISTQVTTHQDQNLLQLVEGPSQLLQRGPLLANITIIAPHYPCITRSVGHTSKQHHDTRQMVTCRDIPSQQSPQIKSNQEWLHPFSSSDHKITHKDSGIQHSLYVLYRSAGGVRLPSLCAEAMRLWHWCISHNITLSAAYHPSTQNLIEDSLSHKLPHDHE